MSLRISTDLILPQETVTSTIVVYGGKGMGKTNLAGVLAEEHDKNGLRFSVLDPLGVNWGLQHGRTRESKGLRVLILGGIHGDIAITPASGAVVADLVVDESVSTVIDISRHANGQMWSMGEKIKFVIHYAQRLFQRQGERRIPIMQIIDEAGRFVPQVIPKNAENIATCVGAIEELVEWGRNVGIGVTLITQRSARMNKSVSELADCMIAFRTVGPHSVEAVTDWLGEHVDKAKIKEYVEQLRKLERGTALIVSPGWLNVERVVSIRMRETFDSSATPKAGVEPRAPGKASKPDLDKYRARMIEVEERARADDPKELRKQIVQLQAELKKANTFQAIQKAVVEEKRVEVSVLTDDDRVLLKEVEEAFRFVVNEITEKVGVVSYYGKEVTAILEKARGAANLPPRPPLKPTKEAPAPLRTERIDPDSVVGRILAHEGADLGDGERKVLTAIAQYRDGVSRTQLTILTGYKRSTRDAYIQRLSRRNLVVVNGDRIAATDDGVGTLGDFEPLPTGEKLQEYWLSKLSGGEKEILQIVLDAYPNPVDRDVISTETGYARSSRDAYIQRMAARKIVEPEGRGMVKASALFFE